MDDIDRNILRVMQRRPDLSIAEIGEQVGLSHTPCWRRIKKLEQSGVIAGRPVMLDAEKLGFGVTIFVMVRLSVHNEPALNQFESAVLEVPQILQCYTMSGEFDYLLRIAVASVRAYEKTVKGKLLHLPHVGQINSHFSLNEIKNTWHLPL